MCSSVTHDVIPLAMGRHPGPIDMEHHFTAYRETSSDGKTVVKHETTINDI